MATNTGKAYGVAAGDTAVNPEELLKKLNDEAAMLESNIKTETAELAQNKKDAAAVKAIVDDIGRAVAQYAQARPKIEADAEKAEAADARLKPEVLCQVGADKDKVDAIIAQVDGEITALETAVETLTSDYDLLTKEYSAARQVTATKKAGLEARKKQTDSYKANFAAILAWQDKIRSEPSPQVKYLLLRLAETMLTELGVHQPPDMVLTVDDYHAWLLEDAGELYEAQQAEAAAKAAADAKNAELAAKQKDLDDARKNRASEMEKRVREASFKPATTAAMHR